ncbi:MAG: hypothetical protein JEZ00_06070 [Anaerolineaceae bacterium]|nr:hypothetical protein [Anaerolineaceae bacterium]
MKDLQAILVQNAKDLPANTSGVYLLFTGDLLDYVGQSENVRNRLTHEHHVYDETVHTLVAFIQMNIYDARLAGERYFNQKYNPPNSYVGSGKQASDFDEQFLRLAAKERRVMWQGPVFDEFDLPGDTLVRGNIMQIVIPASKISLSKLQAPSVLSLPPEELLGF